MHGKYELYKFVLYYDKTNDTKAYETNIKQIHDDLRRIKQFRQIVDYVTASSIEEAYKKINTYKTLYISMFGTPDRIKVLSVKYEKQKEDFFNNQKLIYETSDLLKETVLYDGLVHKYNMQEIL
jgi:hypothetical protein